MALMACLGVVPARRAHVAVQAGRVLDVQPHARILEAWPRRPARRGRLAQRHGPAHAQGDAAVVPLAAKGGQEAAQRRAQVPSAGLRGHTGNERARRGSSGRRPWASHNESNRERHGVRVCVSTLVRA